ncbi:MAG: hypothetical protein R3293_05165 [Candidatus Promineifilaceae bacterium]|nr:hypothetical protein [Candidatus Promineifilaceae bacterium]
MSEEKDLFNAIIDGDAPGNVILKDDQKQIALIECIEPEAAVHWLAVPYEQGIGTEALERDNRERFLELVDFAITHTKSLADEYPVLDNGFSIKFHVGSFETVPHPKLHILSTE